MKSLLFILALLFLYSASTGNITQVIQQLNVAYRTQLNIFINLQDISKDTLDLQVIETPAIQLKSTINAFNKFKLIGSFTENTLVIVHLAETPLVDGVFNILPYLLRDLHELHIVFLTQNDPNNWQLQLFSNCFREGFINALLIYYTKVTQSLYSYNPYPIVQTRRMQGIEDYLNRWRTLENFHHIPVYTFPDIFEPRKLRYVNRKGQLVHAGYVYNAFLEFYKRHNTTVKFVPLLPIDRTFETFFKMLIRKEIDFICYPKELAWNSTSTAPLYPIKNHIMVPHARPLASYLYFARPFTWTVWLAVIGVVAYSSLMLYASYGTDRSEFGLRYLSCWCHLLFLPQPQASIKNWQQCAIHFILILSGFVLTNLFLALLSSMLTLGLYEPGFNTLQDLKYSPYSLLVDDYYVEFFKNATSIPAEVRERMSVANRNILIRARTELNSTFMYSCYEDRMDFILYQQHFLKVPRFKKIPESIMEILLSFPVAESLPYLKMLNAHWRRIFEFGILSKMKSDAWRDTIDSGLYKMMINPGTEQKPYDLEFYFFAFSLWALGLILASLAFLLETQRWRLA